MKQSAHPQGCPAGVPLMLCERGTGLTASPDVQLCSGAHNSSVRDAIITSDGISSGFKMETDPEQVFAWFYNVGHHLITDDVA